jgi:hypothetical protein
MGPAPDFTRRIPGLKIETWGTRPISALKIVGTTGSYPSGFLRRLFGTTGFHPSGFLRRLFRTTGFHPSRSLLGGVILCRGWGLG